MPARRRAAARRSAARAPDSRTSAAGTRATISAPLLVASRARARSISASSSGSSTSPPASSRSATPNVSCRIDDRPRQRHEDVVELGPRLPADAQHVFEPAVATSATRAPLRSSTALVATVDPCTTRRPSPLRTVPRRRQGSPATDRRRRAQFVDDEAVRPEPHEVGERPACVDPEPKHGRIVLSGRRRLAAEWPRAERQHRHSNLERPASPRTFSSVRRRRRGGVRAATGAPSRSSSSTTAVWMIQSRG